LARREPADPQAWCQSGACPDGPIGRGFGERRKPIENGQARQRQQPRRSADRLSIACHLDAKKAARERPDGVAPHAAAKIEHERGMTFKPSFRRLPLDLLDQRVLPIPASPRIKIVCPRPVSRHAASAASDRRSSPWRPTNGRCARNRSQTKKAPCANRLGKAFDFQRAGIDAVEPLGERTTRIIRGQDFAFCRGGG
jgi:hypothetical protein